MNDRIVEFPNKFKLTLVAGTTDIYTITPESGEVTSEGTDINKATLLSDNTAARLNLFDNDAIPDKALARIDLFSYHAFCANVNATSLACAFGQNNEDKIVGLGRQLAMYAWFKGDSRVTYPFAHLLTKDTLLQCLADEDSFLEILGNVNLYNLIQAVPYALARWNTYKVIHLPAIIIYEDGNENASLTGGVNGYRFGSSGSVAKNPTNIYGTCTGNTNYAASVGFRAESMITIPFGYTKMLVACDGTCSYNSAVMQLALTTAIPAWSVYGSITNTATDYDLSVAQNEAYSGETNISAHMGLSRGIAVTKRCSNTASARTATATLHKIILKP